MSNSPRVLLWTDTPEAYARNRRIELRLTDR